MYFDKSLVVREQGQINQMNLPCGWVEENHLPDRTDYGQLRSFWAPSAPDAQICFFYRGIPTGVNAGLCFRTVLGLPIHPLSHDELESITEALGNSSNKKSFEMYSSQTMDLNGKIVLAVVGYWKASNKISHEIFIDCDGTGTVVQQLYFIAPSDKYLELLPVFLTSLESIVWRSAE